MFCLQWSRQSDSRVLIINIITNMIGFKTIDDYTFDECVDYINQHDSSHVWWNSVNLRYSKLFREYQQADNECFQACKTFVDYEYYIGRFSNLQGASKYTPLNIERAKERMSKLSGRRQTWAKRLFRFLSKDASLRNPITNILLYTLLVASLLGTLLYTLLVASLLEIWSYDLWDEKGWSLCDAYGSGFIPALLLCLVTFTSVLNLIQWKKAGLSGLIVGYIIALAPLMWNEFGEFVAFSTPALSGCLILLAIMCIKRKGKSTWSRCVDIPKSIRFVQYGFIGLWLFVVTALPYITALNVGFTHNLYTNGASVINARLNSSPYYSYDLYQKILLGSDFHDNAFEKQTVAEKWLSRAIYLYNRNNTEYSYMDDEFTKPILFINELIFIANSKEHQDAIDFINSEKNDTDMTLVWQYLNEEKWVHGSSTYYRPNREKIMSLLNEANVFAPIDYNTPLPNNRTGEELSAVPAK